MRPTSCPNSSISANVVSTGGPSSPKPHAANAVTHWPNFIFASSVSFTDLRASLLMLVSSLNVLKFPTNRGSIAQPAKSQNPNPPSPRNVKVRSCTRCHSRLRSPLADPVAILLYLPFALSPPGSVVSPFFVPVTCFVHYSESMWEPKSLARAAARWAAKSDACGRKFDIARNSALFSLGPLLGPRVSPVIPTGSVRAGVKERRRRKPP